jgi:polyisoprenoid-binding protein YceI
MALLTVTTSAAAQETYLSDGPHTQAFFEAGHLGISWIRGRFNDVDVKIMLDRTNRSGTVEAVIKTASVDTGHAGRDRHIRSEDFLHVEKFPTMTYRSTKLRFEGDVLVGAEGELTLSGVTRPVALEIPYFKCVQHAGRKTEVCGAEVRTMIKRSEFGVKRSVRSAMDDEMKIAIQVEAYRQQ